MVWDCVLHPVSFNLKLRMIRQAFLHPTSTSGCTLICLYPKTIQHLAIYDTPRRSKPGTHQPNPGNCSPDRKTDNHKGFIQSAVYHFTGIMFRENLINPTCNSVTQKALRKEGRRKKKELEGGKLFQRTRLNQINHYPMKHNLQMMRDQVIIQNHTKEKLESLLVFALCQHLFSTGMFIFLASVQWGFWHHRHCSKSLFSCTLELSLNI